MSEASRSRVTITLGRSGQVVKRPGSSLASSFTDEHPHVGSKRPVRERLGSNVDSSSEDNHKRLRIDGRPENDFDDMHLSKGDLRYKIMQKRVLKQNQNGQQNGGDLRNILSRPAQSSMNGVATRDRMLEAKDTKMRYPEPRDGRQHFTETLDGRSLTPVARNASLHIPEYRGGHAPDPRKQHILEMGDGGRRYFEAQNTRRPMPEHRPSNTVTRMDSGITSFSPWTLDSLRRRSPDESLSTSRVLTAPKKDEILQRRIAATPYDDSRTSTYMSKDAFDISRPMSSSLMTKRAPPVGQMKSMTPVASSLPRPGSFMQKSSYVVDDEVTVDRFLHTLGLEKFTVIFKAEEVDMYSLKRMTERDLKEMGIPMGPRKKILLALQPRLKQPV
ncbi:ankyrin repeat and SAM domain-containing protein 6 [Salvia divinorum]|uniref:Ankyrin repeat and SAM domain-containing protein 6 n=1 Tax=Salvia divinorum TaxID=28513 RepID=A0ABD1H3Y1_SALDI